MLNRELDAVELILDAFDDCKTSPNKCSCMRTYEHPLRGKQELRQSVWPVRLSSSRTGMCRHKTFEGRKYGNALQELNHIYLSWACQDLGSNMLFFKYVEHVLVVTRG